MAGIRQRREAPDDGLEQLRHLRPPTVAEPQLGEVRRGSQLERPGALVARDLERPPVSRLGVGVAARSGDEQVALAAMELRLAPALVGALREGEAFRHEREAAI